MAQYRKKPVVVEAFQFFDDSSGYDVLHWANAHQHARGCGFVSWANGHMLIPTLEGVMRAEPGDWIICGVQGELYPCKPDIFAATYDVAEHEDEQHPSDGSQFGLGA